MTGTLIADAEGGWRPRWALEGEVIACPWHGLEYHVPTGRCLAFPEIACAATRSACAAATWWSAPHPPAVHQQRLAGDEAAVVGGEEGDRAGDVLDLAAALERLGLEHAPPQRLLVGVDRGRGGWERARGDRVDADPLGPASRASERVNPITAPLDAT